MCAHAWWRREHNLGLSRLLNPPVVTISKLGYIVGNLLYIGAHLRIITVIVILQAFT